MMVDLLRALNVLLCSAVFGGLLWRLIGRYSVSFPLARWITGLFATLEFIVAMGTAFRAAVGGPFNPIQFVITVHCIVTLMVIWKWPTLMRAVKIERPSS